jgi:serine/threonine protein kinase
MNEYEWMKLLGAGGTSRVYLVRHRRLHIYRVAKVIRRSVPDQRALHEFQILRHLNHCSIPRIIDYKETDTHIIIFMDYMKGRPLSSARELTDGFPKETFCAVVFGVMDVLMYLHTCTVPVIYLDLKPSNIILQEHGRIALIDFGSALRLDESREGCGRQAWWLTEHYAAPELAGDGRTAGRGKRMFYPLHQRETGGYGGFAATEASDRYSLGVLMYVMLTGEYPGIRRAQNRRALNHCGPRHLTEVVMTCLNKNPALRYEDDEVLLAALKKALW